MSNEVNVYTKNFIAAIEALMPKKLTRINKKSNAELKVFIRLIENQLEISTLHKKAMCPILDGKWDDYVSFQFEFLMPFVKFMPSKEQIKISYADSKIKLDTSSFKASLTKAKRFI